MTLAGISQGIYDQGILFLWGAIWGVVIWFLYDLMRLWRRLVSHSEWWIAAEDIVFFLVCGIVGFQVLYPLSLGEVRVFLLLAIATGSIAYHKLVSPWLIKGGTWLIHRQKKRFSQMLKKRKTKHQQSDKIPIEK